MELINGDVMETLRALPDASIDFVWSDADYNVGIDYDGVDYTMKWNDYVNWYCELARESMRVLKKDGNAFFMNYPKQNSYLRVKCLDDISYDVQEYAWVYNVITGQGKGRFVDRWQAAELALLCGQIDEKRALNDKWEGDEEYMKDFQNQTPHWRGGEERNKCKYCMIYSEDLY